MLALADSAKPVFTWPNAISALVLVIWFVPIKLYALPIELPFNLEPYRLFLLVLVFAWGIQIVIRRGRLDAAGREVAILLLIGVAVVSTIVNFDSLSATADESPVNPVLYFISFLLLFALVASTIDRLPNVEQILRMLVVGGDRRRGVRDLRGAHPVQLLRPPRRVRADPRQAGARGARAARRPAARPRLVAAPDRLRRRADR